MVWSVVRAVSVRCSRASDRHRTVADPNFIFLDPNFVSAEARVAGLYTPSGRSVELPNMLDASDGPPVKYTVDQGNLHMRAKRLVCVYLLIDPYQ